MATVGFFVFGPVDRASQGGIRPMGIFLENHALQRLSRNLPSRDITVRIALEKTQNCHLLVSHNSSLVRRVRARRRSRTLMAQGNISETVLAPGLPRKKPPAAGTCYIPGCGGKCEEC